MRIPGENRWKSARESCVILSIIAMSVLASLAKTSELNELEAESHTESTLRYSSGFSIGQFRAAVVDSEGNLYITGVITSSDFPTTLGAYQTLSM